MKVAIFTDTYLPEVNGVAKTLGRFTDYMNENGIEYRVFAPCYGNADQDRSVMRFPSINFLLYPNSKISFPLYSQIKEELNHFRPDIIHVATPFCIGLCGLIYAKAENIPMVSSYHTNFSQYLEYFNLKLFEQISWKYLKWFHKQSRINYCPSYNTISLLKDKGIENLELWSRGVNTEIFSPIYRDITFRRKLNIVNKIVFLYAGRISPEKDVDILLSTVKQLNEKYLSKIHFLVAGGGPYLDTLKKCNLPNMTLLGFVEGLELSKVYASSDIFIFPSSSETFGNVILEAMASGLPVVACKEGGISDNLIDGYNGIACRKRNIDDFYDACEKLINDFQLTRELGLNGLKHTADLNWNRIFEKLIASYLNVISNSKSMQITKSA